MKYFLSLLLSLSACAANTPQHEVITAQQAQQLLQENSLQILDIRTAEEFANGHLTGAQNLDFYASDFTQQLQTRDPKQPYLLYCASGRRSAEAHRQMQALGFEQVYDIQGGYQAWTATGLPVQKTTP